MFSAEMSPIEYDLVLVLAYDLGDVFPEQIVACSLE